MQYTDAGIHTCSKGQRAHEIPGSYGQYYQYFCILANNLPFNGTGHYEQDANTYASWGVECV